VPALFAEWDKAGQVPAGSRLLRYVGSDLGLAGSGYATPGGKAVKAEDLEPLRVVSTIRVRGGGAVFVVMAPAEGTTS
jgi:hypothetical protein